MPRLRKCAHRPCGRLFLPSKHGRPQLYCQAACRQAAYRERGAPRQAGLVTLLESDARAVLPELQAGWVDLVVTDPPYVFDRGDTFFREWFEDLGDEEWPAIFAQLYRVLARDRDAYVFSDARVKPIFDAAAAAAGFEVRTPIVWDKMSIGMGGAWRAQYEFVNVYRRGQRAPAPFERSLGNVRRHPRVRGYPTEKPLALVRELVQQGSAPGWRVLDPFCGSGVVARAARELGRRALVIDLDTGAAQRRLRVQLAPSLRSAVAS